MLPARKGACRSGHNADETTAPVTRFSWRPTSIGSGPAGGESNNDRRRCGSALGAQKTGLGFSEQPMGSKLRIVEFQGCTKSPRARGREWSRRSGSLSQPGTLLWPEPSTRHRMPLSVLNNNNWLSQSVPGRCTLALTSDRIHYRQIDESVFVSTKGTHKRNKVSFAHRASVALLAGLRFEKHVTGT